MILWEKNKVYSEKSVFVKELEVGQEVLTANISERNINYKGINEIEFIEELSEGIKIITTEGRELICKLNTIIFVGNRKTQDQTILSPIKKKCKECMKGQPILIWKNGVLSWDTIKSKSTIKNMRFISLRLEDCLIVNEIVVGEE